jgi:hypothetical protein
MKPMLPLLLCAGLAGTAIPGWTQKQPVQKPLPPVYTPDLAKWRLEMTPELGGWLTEGKQELRLKLVDPKDPEPPKDEAVQFQDNGNEEEGDYVEPPEKSAEELRQERRYEEESAKRTAWRDRRLLVWFNGSTAQLSTRVGTSVYYSVNSQNGENRLEIWEPDSGQRIVRSWWTSASRTRLSISQVRGTEDDWGSGNLEILEPNGDLASRGKRTASGGTLGWSNDYLHATPSPGTYTIRWSGGYRGGKPFRVVVEALLDGGTDAERRWRFERLMLPGAGPATLGTLDIEN